MLQCFGKGLSPFLCFALLMAHRHDPETVDINSVYERQNDTVFRSNYDPKYEFV